MPARRLARALRRDRRGTTIVEFGLVCVPFLIVLLGTVDLGYYAYVRALLQGALQTAARNAAIANQTPAQIDADVKKTLSAIVPAQYVSTSIHSYYQFSRIGKPEKLLDDKNGDGLYQPGDCYEDANDNNTYDQAATAGRNTGGNADEVVAYTINVDYPRLTGMAGMAGWSPTAHLSGTTMLRNQPFAPATTPRKVCN